MQIFFMLENFLHRTPRVLIVRLHKSSVKGRILVKKCLFFAWYTDIVGIILKLLEEKMKNLVCENKKSVTLAENTVRVGQNELTYRLIEMPKAAGRFFVMLSEKKGVWLTKALGNHQGIAKTVYELLVKEIVFSCHLSEVVDNLLEEQFNQYK